MISRCTSLHAAIMLAPIPFVLLFGWPRPLLALPGCPSWLLPAV